MVHEGKFDHMAAVRGTEIVETPIAEAIKQHKTVDPRLLELSEVFFG
jgi:hypothetical protein